MIPQPLQALRRQSQAGFTLIELIVVIVILGILAATALPRFVNLGSDARIASVNAVRGSLEATSAMIHGQALARPGITPLVVEGINVGVVNNYPAADANTVAAAGLGAGDYTVIQGGAAGVAATPTAPAAPALGFSVIPNSVAGQAAAVSCFVSYTQAASAITPPAIVVTTGSC
jgi:MSHA pilin protein MshA